MLRVCVCMCVCASCVCVFCPPNHNCDKSTSDKAANVSMRLTGLSCCRLLSKGRCNALWIPRRVGDRQDDQVERTMVPGDEVTRSQGLGGRMFWTGRPFFGEGGRMGEGDLGTAQQKLLILESLEWKQKEGGVTGGV